MKLPRRARSLRAPVIWRGLTVVMVAVAVLVGLPASADAAVVFEVTTPHTNLTVTTPIEVSVTGLQPNQYVSIGQCSADGMTCNGGALQPADATGSLSTTSVAMVILSQAGLPNPPPAVDCRLETCTIVLVDESFQIVASVPVTFTPDATPPAPVTLTPSTGLVAGQQVTLNIPVGHLFPNFPLGLGQCPDDPSSLILCEGYTPGAVETDPLDGSLILTMGVSSSVMLNEAPGEVSCTPTGCAIFVTRYPFDTILWQFPLTFAPPPPPGSDFHPVAPTRILDSRTSVGGWNGPLVAGAPRNLQVTLFGGGPSPVPPDATSVVVNVTATEPTANSFVTVSPAGAAASTASNLNFAQGQTIANLVTVKVGTEGHVQMTNAAGAVEVVADIVGYYDVPPGSGDRYNGTDPARVLDSRTTTGGWNAPLAAGTPRDLTVRGVGGVPATATTVIANVTATDGSDGSFLAVWPSGSATPTASTLNFAPGQTIANLAVVPIGSNDKITIANAVGSVEVIVDVVGYFDPTSGSRYHALAVPTRILDDRDGTGLDGPWGTMQSRTLGVGGVSGIHASATGVVMNTTVTGGTAGSFLTVYPTGDAVPPTSNVNFGPGETIANLVISPLSAPGDLDIHNHQGSVDIIGDVAGYFNAE